MTAPSGQANPDAKTFVAELMSEIKKLFSQLGDHETLEAESGGSPEVVPLLKLALTSELEAAEIAAHWLPDTPEIEAKTILAEQCSDELRHYNMIMERLRELGEDMDGFNPLDEGYSPLFHFLRTLRTTEERIAAGPFACEAVAEIRNAQFIDFCLAAGDQETAAMYEKTIHPEEIHHHHRGREYLEKVATTPEIQERVRNAVHSSLAIADELQILTERTTGLHPVPLS